jgi:hypothetical protein
LFDRFSCLFVVCLGWLRQRFAFLLIGVGVGTKIVARSLAIPLRKFVIEFLGSLRKFARKIRGFIVYSDAIYRDGARA